MALSDFSDHLPRVSQHFFDYENTKQYLGHARFLESHALGKLVLSPAMLSSKDSHCRDLVKRTLLSIR